MSDKKLTHPNGGLPIDTAGMPVTVDPVEGGVRTENLSLPPDHEARVVYRELSADEKKQRQQDATDAVSFRNADTLLFVRMSRDALLRATDHFELPNAEAIAGSKAKLDSWRKWRQELRDLPSKLSKKKSAESLEPEDVKWPKPPAAISALLAHRSLFPDVDFRPLLS